MICYPYCSQKLVKAGVRVTAPVVSYSGYSSIDVDDRGLRAMAEMLKVGLVIMMPVVVTPVVVTEVFTVAKIVLVARGEGPVGEDVGKGPPCEFPAFQCAAPSHTLPHHCARRSAQTSALS